MGKLKLRDKKNIKDWLAILFLMVFVVHGSYIRNGFTWLDHGDIEQERSIVALEDIGSALVIRFGATNFYRPMVTMVHSIDRAVYGDNPFGFHLTNVLLHSLTAVVSYFFLMRYFGLGKNEALVGGFVFGVHPLSWLPVGSISNRPEILVSLFTMLCLIFYIKARGKKRLSWMFLSEVFLVLALMSKEVALVWIVGLVVLWELRRDESRVSKAKESLGLWVLMIGTLGGYFWIRSTVGGNLWQRGGWNYSVGEYVGTRILVVGRLILNVFNPLKPSLSDAVRVVGLTDARVVALLILLTVGAYKSFGSRLKSTAGQLFLFLLIAVSPGLNLIHLPRFYSPHYSYFASIGAGVMAVLVLRRLKSKGRWGKILVSGWVLAMVVTIYSSGSRFSNDGTLFAPEVLADANFLEGHFYLGNYYSGEGHSRMAVVEYEQALKGQEKIIALVDETAVRVNLAGVKLSQGRLDEAKLVLEQASVGDKPEIRFNLALIEWEMGNYEAVIKLLEGLDWDEAEAYLLLAKAYERSGFKDKAREDLVKALPYLESEQQEEIKKLIEIMDKGKI